MTLVAYDLSDAVGHRSDWLIEIRISNSYCTNDENFHLVLYHLARLSNGQSRVKLSMKMRFVF